MTRVFAVAEDSKAARSEEPIDVWRIIPWVAGAWVVWFLAGIGLFVWFGKTDPAGQFGDWFGSFTSAFTALAFAAVWWTGSMQRVELIEQRKELALQRKELESTRAVHSKQQFEATFFRLLELLQDLDRQIDAGVPSHWRSHAHQNHFQALKGVFWNGLDRDYAKETLTLEIIDKNYRATVSNNFALFLGPYYRTMFNILRIIDNTFKDDNIENEKSRVFYGNILRGQLSEEAAELLALNCLSSASGRMKHFVERYRLLKYIADPRIKKIADAFIGQHAQQPRNDD